MPIKKELYERVSKVFSTDELKTFCEEMIKEIDKDNAQEMITAVILAAAHMVVNMFPEHIDTKDKSGTVMWNFVRHWMPEFSFAPLRILIYEDLLYPQFEANYRTISKEVWEWVKREAQILLDNKKDAVPQLCEHWQSVIDGNIPYGLILDEDFAK